MKTAAFSLALCIAFYTLLADMCIHLRGWRVTEPFAFLAIVICMAALARVIFGEYSKERGN